MAIDIIARGLATSLVGPDGKIASDKMPTLSGTEGLTGFYPLGKLTDPSLVEGKTAEEILVSQTDRVQVLDPASQQLCGLGQLTCLL